MLLPIDQWQVLGQPQGAVLARDKVTGAHQYPSDMKRPGMLYGAVLRSPTYRGKLVSVDLEPARAMAGVIVVKDGDFVGVAAPTSYAARQAIDAIAKTAKWDESPLPPSEIAAEHLREHAEGRRENPHADDVKAAAKSLKQIYHIAYVQHAPLEPRTALAEWADGKLTVWTGTQGPFRVKGELQGAFRLADDAVRVIVPDFGAGYGGKHTGEVSVEAARLAKEAGKPVMLRWTREEEFNWAYFRPAGVMEMEASLDANGRLTTWRHINISSGGNSLESPYSVAKKDERRSARGRRCARARIGHWRQRAIRSPANRSWTNWRCWPARSARISAGAFGGTALAAGARSGGGEIRLAQRVGDNDTKPRRRHGVQFGQGFGRCVLRRGRSGPRLPAISAWSRSAKRSSAARFSIPKIFARRSKGRS